jgi:hypothetical protein
MSVQPVANFDFFDLNGPLESVVAQHVTDGKSYEFVIPWYYFLNHNTLLWCRFTQLGSKHHVVVKIARMRKTSRHNQKAIVVFREIFIANTSRDAIILANDTLRTLQVCSDCDFILTRGEKSCNQCTVFRCVNSTPVDSACAVCLEPLRGATTKFSECNHVVHIRCSRQRLTHCPMRCQGSVLETENMNATEWDFHTDSDSGSSSDAD